MSITESEKPQALRRADFFPDPRRRHNASKKPLPAFQQTARCPKPKAPVSYKQYLGRDVDLTRRLTYEEHFLVEAMIANADIIDVRDVKTDDIGRGVGPTAFLLVSIPAWLLDHLAAFRAGLEDFEEGGEVEGLCIETKGEAVNEDGCDPEGDELEQVVGGYVVGETGTAGPSPEFVARARARHTEAAKPDWNARRRRYRPDAPAPVRAMSDVDLATFTSVPADMPPGDPIAPTVFATNIDTGETVPIVMLP